MHYRNLITEITREMGETLTPRQIAGVEASMRLEYGTLDRLPKDRFRGETRLALQCEQYQPGYLERLAATYGD